MNKPIPIFLNCIFKKEMAKRYSGIPFRPRKKKGGIGIVFCIIILVFSILFSLCGNAFLVESAKAGVRSPSSRIVGGEPAEEDAWPWIALLLETRFDSYRSSGCSASLIHPEWVLTAAHCLKSQTGIFLEAEEIDVVLGVYNLETDTGERVSSSRVVIHPLYDSQSAVTDENDIALIRLSRLVDFPVADMYSGNDDLAGRQGTALGWGTLSAHFPLYPNRLYQVTMPIISNDECNYYFNQLPFYDDPITENMMCAGLVEGGKDACLGDSGGPLVIWENGAEKVAGIVSWGEGCAEAEVFGVYTRVSHYTDFIVRTIENRNLAPMVQDVVYPVDFGKTLVVDAPGLLAYASDPENDPLTLIQESGVMYGSLDLDPDGSFIYVHGGQELVSDRFEYRVSDGMDVSKRASVTLNIVPEKNEPVPVKGDDGGGSSPCFVSGIRFFNP